MGEYHVTVGPNALETTSRATTLNVDIAFSNRRRTRCPVLGTMRMIGQNFEKGEPSRSNPLLGPAEDMGNVQTSPPEAVLNAKMVSTEDTSTRPSSGLRTAFVMSLGVTDDADTQT